MAAQQAFARRNGASRLLDGRSGSACFLSQIGFGSSTRRAGEAHGWPHQIEIEGNFYGSTKCSD